MMSTTISMFNKLITASLDSAKAGQALSALYRRFIIRFLHLCFRRCQVLRTLTSLLSKTCQRRQTCQRLTTSLSADFSQG